jgi:hypothetical protein
MRNIKNSFKPASRKLLAPKHDPARTRTRCFSFLSPFEQQVSHITSLILMVSGNLPCIARLDQYLSNSFALIRTNDHILSL